MFLLSDHYVINYQIGLLVFNRSIDQFYIAKPDITGATTCIHG